MSRRGPDRAGHDRAGRQRGAAEVTVSRLEQHHVDALEAAGGDWQDRAQVLLDGRAAGTGFGLAAVQDDKPVGLVGVRTGEEGWRLHGLAVVPGATGQEVARRLVVAVEELARPLGSLRADVDGDAARQALQQLGWAEAGGGYVKQFG